MTTTMSSAPADRAELADWLAGRSLAEPGAVTAVVPLHQRSWCYRVDVRDADPVFVKQARATATGEWSADVSGEADRLQHLTVHLPDHDFYPRLLTHDATRRRLATTCYPDHRQLDRAKVGSDVGPTLMRALGSAVAVLHTLVPTAGDPAASALPAAGSIHAVLTTLLRPTPTVIASFPAGYLEVLLAIRTRGLAEPLTELGRQSRSTAFIHGDLKSDNVLGDDTSVRLIDWETSGSGDPRWDIGAVIGDQVFGWLAGLPFTVPGGLPAWLAGAARPLDEVRADLSAFRVGYLAAGGADYVADPQDVALCLGFAAAFLLQRATAAALSAPVLPPLALAAVHLAQQLLTRPAHLGAMLLSEDGL